MSKPLATGLFISSDFEMFQLHLRLRILPASLKNRCNPIGNFLKTCYVEKNFCTIKEVLNLTKHIDKNWFSQIPILRT